MYCIVCCCIVISRENILFCSITYIVICLCFFLTLHVLNSQQAGQDGTLDLDPVLDHAQDLVELLQALENRGAPSDADEISTGWTELGELENRLAACSIPHGMELLHEFLEEELDLVRSELRSVLSNPASTLQAEFQRWKDIGEYWIAFCGPISPSAPYRAFNLAAFQRPLWFLGMIADGNHRCFFLPEGFGE